MINILNDFSRWLLSLFKVLRDALKELLKNDPLRMAGATAFFTIFALPPILIIIIQVFGLFVDPANMSQHLFSRLSQDIGAATTEQVINTFKAIREIGKNWPVIILGFVFLLFVATTLFKIIQNSINQIWKITASGQKIKFKTLKNRSHALIVILFAGIIFILAILAETGQAFLGNIINELVPSLSPYFNTGLGYSLSVLFVTIWFALVFRFLPNGVPTWRVAITGAFVTSILFNFGKFVLRFALGKSNLNNFYGASGSIVLLLLFVFYCALIIYFGAAFTKMWGIAHGKPIRPHNGFTQYRLEKINSEDH